VFTNKKQIYLSLYLNSFFALSFAIFTQNKGKQFYKMANQNGLIWKIWAKN